MFDISYPLNRRVWGQHVTYYDEDQPNPRIARARALSSTSDYSSEKTRKDQDAFDERPSRRVMRRETFMNSDTNLHRKPTFMRRRKSEDLTSVIFDPAREVLEDRESAVGGTSFGSSGNRKERKMVNRSFECLNSRNASTVYH